MKWKFLLLFIFSFNFLFASSNLSTVFAQDSGSIQVTGTVPPTSSSVTTNLSIAQNLSSIDQDTEQTYQISYTSDNSGSVSISLQVEWSKGQVEGATEPSVEVMNYVVGSASKAYGNNQPIVDTLKKQITWNIPNLSGGLGTQTVSFKLKASDTYTGSLPVAVPVRLKVLYPTGITDKVVNSTYRYKAPTASATPTPTPSISPTPTSTASALLAPIPTISSVRVTSVDTETAKIAVTLSTPGKITINYGLSPSELNSQISSTTTSVNHSLTLDELIPQKNYYFKVLISQQPQFKSDVFTFITAGKQISLQELVPTSINITHQRSLLYSGPTNSSTVTTAPISVTQNGVLDLSISLPTTNQMASVEIIIRHQDVLGVSTVTSDDLQSQNTKMTRISPSVYVGKVKTPPNPGKYLLVASIEDIYGNLFEKELGSLVVVKPFTIRDGKSGEPISGAQVDLFIYNHETRLFELVSNVSSSIDNPTFSDEQGIVDQSFPAARYLAVVNAQGYKKTQVEFEVGENQQYDFPQLNMEGNGNFLAKQYYYSSGLINNEWKQLMNFFKKISQRNNIYLYLIIWQILLSIFLVFINIFFLQSINFFTRTPKPKSITIFRFAAVHFLRFGLEYSLFANLIISYFFWWEKAIPVAFLFSTLAVINIILWLRFVWLRFQIFLQK